MKSNYSRLLLTNYIYIFVIELVFKLLVFQSIDTNIIYLAIFSFPIASIITFFTNLFKSNKLNKFLTIVVWLALFIVFVAEVIYYSFYQTVFSYQAIAYGSQVAEYYDSIYDHIIANGLVLLSLFIPLLILLIFNRVYSFKRGGFKTSLLFILVSIILAGSSLCYKMADDNSLYKLLVNKNDVMETSNTIGLLSTINIDIVKNLCGFEEKIELVIDESKPVIEITEETKDEYNVTDIDFEKLINTTSDSSIQTLHKYFSNQNPTKKNEMSGIFKDKNLIFITAEAFYPIAVDATLTPTLYKLVNEGINFKNFYQPIYNCSTSDGEFVNLLSLLPGISTCSMDQTHDVYLPYTIGNSFKPYGYDTYAFHGWTYTYYKRNKTYPNLGFDKYYGFDRNKTGYKYALEGIKNQWPTSDIEVVNSSFPIFSESEKFVAYYMSISGHLQYNFGGNAMSAKNKSLVKDVKGNEAIKAYIAANIEFDRSLEILLKDLEEKGILDDTVIVISPDHYPYGLTNADIKSYTNFVENEAFDIYRNNLIIYNTELTGVTVDKNVGSIDILPTLLNMFGIKYDSRLLMGHDIFSDTPDLVIYNNKSWITDKGRYDYMKKKFYPFAGQSVDNDYISKINNIVSTKFQVSKTILQKNYYKNVLGE